MLPYPEQWQKLLFPVDYLQIDFVIGGKVFMTG